MNIYRGIVTNNDDPKKGGRCQVRIFELHGIPDTYSELKYETKTDPDDESKYNIKDEDLPWAEIMQPIDYIGFFNCNHFDQNEKDKTIINGKGSVRKKQRKVRRKEDKRGGFGYNRILEIGTWVFCILEQSNPNMPIIIGTIASETEYNDFSTPTNKRVYESTSGHYEQWEDTPNKENIIIHHRTGTDIEFEPDGSLETLVVKDKKEHIMEKNMVHIDQTSDTYIKQNVNEIYDENHINKTTQNLIENIGESWYNKTGHNFIQDSGNVTKMTAQIIFLN